LDVRNDQWIKKTISTNIQKFKSYLKPIKSGANDEISPLQPLKKLLETYFKKKE
jgi:hypothetical protein